MTLRNQYDDSSSDNDIEIMTKNEYQSKEEADDDEEDIDLYNQLKCPLSDDQDMMERAAKSTICGHVFERANIIAYIKKNWRKKGAKCPIPECDKMLRERDIITDKVYQAQIDQMNGKTRKRDLIHSNDSNIPLKKRKLNHNK